MTIVSYKLKEDFNMNAFVAGNVNEVRALGNNLLNAAKAVEESIDGSNVEIKYKDGEIIISYKPIIDTNLD